MWVVVRGTFGCLSVRVCHRHDLHSHNTNINFHFAVFRFPVDLNKFDLIVLMQMY